MDFDSLVKSDLERRIKATQSYFSLFEKNLSAAELDRLIIGKKESSENYKAVDPVNGSAKNLLEIAEKKKWIFDYVPFVKSVMLCNYLSFGIAEKDSDIDLLIIAEKNRIYLCRFYTTLLLHLAGIRRHGKKIRARFCLSFYLSESYLNLSDIVQSPYDIYLAYWFLGLKELLSYDQSIWGSLLETNKIWLERYFDRIELRRESAIHSTKKSFFGRLLEWFLAGWIGDRSEQLLRWYFEGRASKLAKSLPANASIVVSEKMQKFHNNDRRFLFRKEWEDKLDRLSLLK